MRPFKEVRVIYPFKLRTKFRQLNQVLHLCNQEYETTDVYRNGSLLIEELMRIKKSLVESFPELADFRASDGGFATWKKNGGGRKSNQRMEMVFFQR